MTDVQTQMTDVQTQMTDVQPQINKKPLRYEVIYNFVEKHMRERISKITIQPDNNVIPVTVVNGKSLTEKDIIVYNLIYRPIENKHIFEFTDFAKEYDIDISQMTSGEKFKLSDDYKQFVLNRYCLQLINCFSEKDQWF